jgi:hypothetical protein
MTDWIQIKKNLIKEIKSTVNTIDPAFNVEESVSLYLKILKYSITIPHKDDLEGLENIVMDTLNQCFVEDKINEISIGTFCKNFEQFVKKIYYILEESEAIDTEFHLDSSKLHALTPFLSKLNKVKPVYLDNSGADVFEAQFAKKENGKPKYKINSKTEKKTYVRLYPSSLNFDKYTDIDNLELNTKYQNDFKLYLLKAIILKNEQSHQAPDTSRYKLMGNLHSTLIAELWVINFLKKELTNAIRIVNLRKRDFGSYIDSEIEKYKNQSSKFVSLNLKELSTVAGNPGRSILTDTLITEQVRRIRLLGQGGSGKTTTMEYLFYKDALNWQNNKITSKLPVIVSLASLSIGESIIENISKKINIEESYTEELLSTNDLNLFLDGVNEIISNRESKKIKLQEIGSLIDHYPELSIVISDRYEFDSYQNNMFNVPTYLIQKLSEDQIQEFVEKYCYGSNELSEKVMSTLKSKVGIQELLLRPLVLTRAIEIIKIDNDLPEKEGQIIEKFIDTLLRREKDEKKDPLLNITHFKLLLAYAANNIWINKDKSNVPIHEFSFNKLLIKAADEFGLEKFNAGYIMRIGYELEILSKNDEHIKFYHQSYLEFFVKHYLKYELH